MSKNRKFKPGDRIGGWTLIEYPYRSKKVLVKCDCGFEAWRWLSNFSSGTSTKCANCKKVSPAEQTYRHVRWTAGRRGIDFLLSFDEWQQLATSPCYYCGSEPSNKIAVHGYTYNGVDRIDSSGCYDSSNCVSSCKICNRAKSDTSQKEFYEWVKRVYARATTVS